VYIYTVGQGSFVSSVSPNGVHMVRISTEDFRKCVGRGNRWLCCRV